MLQFNKFCDSILPLYRLQISWRVKVALPNGSHNRFDRDCYVSCNKRREKDAKS